MAEKLFECEYTQGKELVFRIKRPGMQLLSPEARGHLLDARKDVLMAVRSLIDAALSGLEEKKASRKRTVIKVE
jgi:hypothetical protein